MDRIIITEPMGDALIGSVTVNDSLVVSSLAQPKTRRALARKGLIEDNLSERLTERGLYLRFLLVSGSKRRQWRVGNLDYAARVWRLGRERDAATRKIQPDDSLGLRGPKEWKAVNPATTTLGKPVTDFQVKIWYASGSSEVVSHIDFMAAAGIYSEAMDNPRVIAAEAHCPGGCLAATFRREVDTPQERG